VTKKAERVALFVTRLQVITAALERAASSLRLRFVPEEYRPTPRLVVDRWIGIGLALTGAAIAVWASGAFDPRVNEYWNIYFHADPNRVLAETMLHGNDTGFRRVGGVHPIFSILIILPMATLMKLGLSQLTAFVTLLVACAGLSAGTFYFVMRGLGLSIPAALAFSGAFMASATFIHWISFVETYAFSLLTVVTMLLVATTSRYRPILWILASAGTLSITITNWALGLTCAFFNLTIRRFILVSAGAFFVVAGIAVIQKIAMPASALFFSPYVFYNEAGFTQIAIEKRGYSPWSPAENVRAVLLTSAVAPPPALEDDPTPAGTFRLVSYQHSQPTKSIVGGAAIVCWIFLLIVGVWGAWRTLSHRAIALSVGSFALFQLALHSVYGEITFLYAANFFPALLVLAALGWLTPLRNYVTSAAVAFTVLGGMNNYSQFLSTARMANEIAANYPDRYRPCSKLTPARLCEDVDNPAGAVSPKPRDATPIPPGR
jgi:hypothetical protein